MEKYGTEIPTMAILGERALWRAVITQALMDASSQSKKMELKYEKSQAICWLTVSGDDFRTVCENAGYCPYYIREQSIEALKRDCKWRAAPANTTLKKISDISSTLCPTASTSLQDGEYA